MAIEFVEVVNQQGSAVVLGPTVTLSDVDAGDLLIADLSFRVYGDTLTLDPPFTPVMAQQQIAPSFQNVGHQTLYRIAEAGDTVITSTGVGSHDVSLTVRRFRGATTLQTFDEEVLEATFAVSDPNLNECGTVTPTSGPVLLVGSVITAQGDGDAYSGAAVFPAIEDFEAARGGSGSGWYGHRVVADPAGPYSMGAVITHTGYTRGYGGVLMAFSGEVAPPPPGITITIEGVEITDASEKSIRVEMDGVGQGTFKLNRYSSQATATNLAQGNLVKVTYPIISPDPIFAWFLETGDFDLVSRDEKGGENLVFAGRGARSYLGRARMWTESFIAEQTVLLGPRPRWIYTKSGGVIVSRVAEPFNPAVMYTVGPVETLDWPSVGAKYQNRTYVPLTSGPYAGLYVNTKWLTAPYVGAGTWRLFASSTGSKPGQILRRIIAEAQHGSHPAPALAGMTVDFDYTVDSNGDPWASSDATDEFTAQVGEDLDSITQRLIDTGAIDVVMDPDMVLHAYNAYGRDLTSATFAEDKVRFERGVNIADTLRRSVGLELPATHAIVDGDDEIVAIAELPDAEFRPTVHSYISIEGTDPAVLTASGQAILIDALSDIESVIYPFAVVDRPADGLYLPGPEGTNGHVWIGDTVTLHTGTSTIDYNESEPRVMAVTISEDDAANIDSVVELAAAIKGQLRGRRWKGSWGTGETRGTLPYRPLTKRTDGEFSASALEGELIDGADVDLSGVDHGALGGLDDPGSHEADAISINDAGGYFDATDAEGGLQELAGKDIGYQDHGNAGSTETFDAGILWHRAVLNANLTATFTGASVDLVAGMILELEQDGTGSRLVTWPGSVQWLSGSAPTLTPTPGDADLLTFFSHDGGTTWIGAPMGGAGAAGVVVSDDTPLVESGAGDPGTSPDASRSDHVHPEDAGGGALDPDEVRDAGRWEVAMEDGVTSPPVPVTTEDGSDWLYIWVTG